MCEKSYLMCVCILYIRVYTFYVYFVKFWFRKRIRQLSSVHQALWTGWTENLLQIFCVKRNNYLCFFMKSKENHSIQSEIRTKINRLLSFSFHRFSFVSFMRDGKFMKHSYFIYFIDFHCVFTLVSSVYIANRMWQKMLVVSWHRHMGINWFWNRFQISHVA